MLSARAWPWKRWTSVWFAGTYRYRETVYHIAVTQTVAAGEGIGMTANARMTVIVDDIEQDDQPFRWLMTATSTRSR